MTSSSYDAYTTSSYDAYTATYSSYSYSSYEYSSYTFPTTTQDTFSTAAATSAATSGSNLIADTNDAGSMLRSLKVMGVVIAAFSAGLILL